MITTPWPPAKQLATVNILLSFIFLAKSVSVTPASISAFLNTGCAPFLLAHQPITGPVIRSCRPKEIILFFCVIIIKLGSTRPLICVATEILPPLLCGILSVSKFRNIIDLPTLIINLSK